MAREEAFVFHRLTLTVFGAMHYPAASDRFICAVSSRGRAYYSPFGGKNCNGTVALARPFSGWCTRGLLSVVFVVL
jgi:hypothetical protein